MRKTVTMPYTVSQWPGSLQKNTINKNLRSPTNILKYSLYRTGLYILLTCVIMSSACILGNTFEWEHNMLALKPPPPSHHLSTNWEIREDVRSALILRPQSQSAKTQCIHVFIYSYYYCLFSDLVSSATQLFGFKGLWFSYQLLDVPGNVTSSAERQGECGCPAPNLVMLVLMTRVGY